MNPTYFHLQIEYIPTVSGLLILNPRGFTFLSGILVSWVGVEVAAEAAGVVGVMFGQSQSDVSGVIDGDGEPKLLTPEFVESQLCAHKHAVRRVWQR